MKQHIPALAILIGLAGCAPQDRVIIEQSSSPAHPAMAMPPKPEGTARIVVFRQAARSRLLPASQPSPILLLNGDLLGEASRETLYIKDVSPGDHEITIAIRTASGGNDLKIEATTLRGSLNAGGEWFIESSINYYNCDGIKPVSPNAYGSPMVTAGGLVISFASVLAAMATTSCETSLQLSPKWPKFGHQEIYPLLAKYRALPLEVTPTSDIRLPKSDLRWETVERVVRRHFDDNSRQFTPYIDKTGAGNLLLQNISLREDSAKNLDGTVDIIVVVEYLHVDEKTIAGLSVKRPLRYRLQPSGDWLNVVSWADVN